MAPNNTNNGRVASSRFTLFNLNTALYMYSLETGENTQLNFKKNAFNIDTHALYNYLYRALLMVTHQYKKKT